MILSAKSTVPMESIWQYGDDYVEFLKKELSKRMAEGVLDILSREPSVAITKQDLKSFPDFNRNEANYQASIEWKPLVKCKECKHRPKKPYPGASRFNLQFPDGACPYYCDDGYYCEYPSDEFFCANGEREEKANE